MCKKFHRKKNTCIFQVADRVEKTRQIEAIARLYDSLDNPLVLDYENLKIYELREQAWNPNILNIEIGHFSNLDAGEIRYFITGAELGETKLTITSGTGEKAVTSPAYPIQVSTNALFYSNMYIFKIRHHNSKNNFVMCRSRFLMVDQVGPQ